MTLLGLLGLLVGSAGACSGGSGSQAANPPDVSEPQNEGGAAGAQQNDAGAAGAKSAPLTNFSMDCTGLSDCQGTQFCVTEAMCGACVCTQPVQVECTSAYGCTGEKTCLAEDSCDPCLCSALGNAWIVKGQGTAREVEATPTGGVVVRLDGAPWFVEYDRLGIDMPLATTLAFDWVSSFVVAADASLYVAGLRNKLITVSHLSATGTLMNLTTWPADFSEFGTMVSAPNGQLYVSARLPATGVFLVAVNADGSPGMQTRLGVRDVPKRVALNAAGDIVDGTPADGAVSYDTAAETDFIPAVKGNTSILPNATKNLGNYIAGIAPVGKDGWVFATASRTDVDLGAGTETWSATLHRVDARGAKVWDLPDLVGSREMPFALLSDSVYLGTDRISLSGRLISKVGESTSPPPVGSAAAGPSTVIVVRSTGDQTYSVERFEFPELSPVKHAIGDACATSTDCPKGSGCCDNVCAASAKCPLGSTCSSGIACEDTCYSAPGAPGFCARSCVATKDCDTGYFCTSGVCLPSCGNGSCPFHASCQSEPDAEGISVKVCSY